MTSLSPTRAEPPSATGRSVRDIVETSPALVNEVWCRKIFRQILQSLELQYAMQMPHRAITADTVVFQENGEPLLVPAQVGEPAHTEPEDLQALAAVVHYAITREPVPTGPLRGRALEGYSESLITAVDRCLAPDPAQRPRHIDELRNILGIVSLGPPTGAQLAPARMGARAATASPAPNPAASALAGGGLPDGMHPGIPDGMHPGIPSFMHGAPRQGRGAGLSRWQRWAIAGGGGAVLAALALVMFAELRDSGSYDHIVLTLPQTGEHSGDGHANDALLAGLPPRAQDPAPASTGASGSGATASGAQDQAGAANAPDGAAPPYAGSGAPAPFPATGHHGPAARATAVPHGGASYRLRIQPWGVVYVDGVDRGVSPPVKRLALAPGRHTLRVANPAYQDRVLEIDTGGGDGVVAVDFNDGAK